MGKIAVVLVISARLKLDIEILGLWYINSDIRVKACVLRIVELCLFCLNVSGAENKFAFFYRQPAVRREEEVAHLSEREFLEAIFLGFYLVVSAFLEYKRIPYNVQESSCACGIELSVI